MGKRGPERINDARLYLILPASLKAALEQAATANGETVSEYVRRVIARDCDLDAEARYRLLADEAFAGARRIGRELRDGPQIGKGRDG